MLFRSELSYRFIFDANVIIERSESNNSQLTPEEIIYFKAEAMFFRAFAYNMLANLYGGVPIVLEEIKTPKRDFVRSSRQEVYEQCAKDLEYAVSHLKDIDDVDDSRINMLAASHVLAEVYISLGRWQDAINEASKVINHPRTGLMTERFGNSTEYMFNDPNYYEGDVY